MLLIQLNSSFTQYNLIYPTLELIGDSCILWLQKQQENSLILAGYLKSLGFLNHKFKRLVWVKIWLKKHPRLIVQGKQRHTKLESFFIPTALFCISQLTTTQPHQKVNQGTYPENFTLKKSMYVSISLAP